MRGLLKRDAAKWRSMPEAAGFPVSSTNDFKSFFFNTITIFN